MKLWIARDSYGLWLFRRKPTKYLSNGDKCFNKSGNTRYLIDSQLFPEVTFENSPQQVEIKLMNGLDPKSQPCVLTNRGIDTDVIFK